MKMRRRPRVLRDERAASTRRANKARRNARWMSDIAKYADHGLQPYQRQLLDVLMAGVRVVIRRPRRPEPRNDLADAFMHAWAADQPKIERLNFDRFLGGDMRSISIHEATPGDGGEFFRQRWIPRAEYEATWIGIDPAKAGSDMTSE